MSTQTSVETVTVQNFTERVVQSVEPVIVDFTAEWCPPCKALAPVFERLSIEYSGRVRFARLDVDEEAEIAARYNIQAMPTLGLFAHGQLVTRIVGPLPSKLKQRIDEALMEIV